MFFDFPEVEIAIKTSPLRPKAVNGLEKTSLKEKSLEHAVIVELSICKQIAGIGFLLTVGLSLINNSAVKCCASAADPPFPQKKIFFWSKIEL